MPNHRLQHTPEGARTRPPSLLRRNVRSPEDMKWDIIRGTANAGIALTICLAGLIASFVIYARLNLSHPLEGGFIASALVLGSPLIVAFQVLAIIMTRMSDITGPGRIAAYAINILGAVIGILFVMFFFFLWRMGPINPG